MTFAVKFASNLPGAPSNEFAFVARVTGQPANTTAFVGFQNALLDPFPATLGLGIPQFTASAPSRLLLPRNAVLITSAGAALSTTLQMAIAITGGGTTLDGTAMVPAGATMTISVNGRSAVAVSSGPFSIPFQ